MELYSNKISDIYWYPINFNYMGNKIDMKKTYFVFNNGFKSNIYEFLKNPSDIKINKKTGIVLTDFLLSEEIFDDKNSQEILTDLTKIETPLKTTDSFVITLSTYQNKNILYKSYNTSYSYLDTIKIIFDNDTVSLESNNENVLTYDSSNNLFFSSRISPPSDTQKFNYILGDDNILLFSYGSNYTKAVTIGNNRILSLTTISYGLDTTLEDNKILNFISYKRNTLTLDNVKNSYFCRYESSPLLSQKDLIPSEESLTENYKQNFLSYFPYQNPKFNDTFETIDYDLQIHGLKNYQTPEYNYSRGVDYVDNFPSIRRRYNNIFSGTNQENGLENVYLGFTANTYLKNFEPDRNTVFYFPPTTQRISVNDAGLIEDGAYYGELPYVSDRIYSRQVSYEELTPGIPQPASMSRLDGTWLCTWLSGNNSTGDKKWMDRFFNSAYYTTDTALGATDLLYNEKLNPNVDFEVWDEVSSMYFEPGGQYIYFRSGQENSKTFLTYLSSDFYNPLGSKILDISNFTTSPLIDNTPYSNDGFIVGNEDSNFNSDYLKLNGKNHIIFPAKNVLLEKNHLTLSLWLRVDDWGNINGDQIIGNYYDSGFGFINEAALTSPLFTVVDSTSGNIFNLNFKLSHIDNISIPQETNSQNNIIQRLLDFSYWVVDSYNRKLRKYNIEGKIEKTVDVSSHITYIDQLEIDSQENLYLYSVKDKKVVILDSKGEYIKSVTHIEEYKRIETRIKKLEENEDIEDNIIYSYGNTSCIVRIDNKDSLWEVIGGNLYKDQQIYANLGPMQQISCDSKNNLWLVHQKDKITKFNITEDRFEFTKSIGKNALIDEDCFEYNGQFRFLNFIKTPKISKTCVETSDKTEDLAILVDDSDKLVYLINSEGALVSRLSLYGLLTVDLSTIIEDRNFKALGDFSSYQFLRKFGLLEKNLSWKFKIATANGKDGKLLKLTYDVKDLPPGWHNFVFNFDSTNGNAKYYIDTILVDTEYFDKAKYQLQYDYKSSILVGASNIKNTTLNDLIQVEDAYKLLGDIGQILMYNKSLTNGEISQIYFASDLSIDKGTLKWNIPIGERNYVEEIKHWFQMQLPTSKSKYYNINIHNLQANDEVKSLIEDSIRSNIKKITPAHTDLYKINWMDSNRQESKNIEYSNLCIPPPTYQLTSNKNSVNEPDSVIFTLTTTNVSNGTNVPYTITGVSPSDIGGVALNGNFVVNNNNTATLTLNITEDNFTEGTDYLTVFSGEQTKTVTINDTSLTPTYQLTSNKNSVNEPDSVIFTLTTTNVANGTNVPYTITGVSPSDINDVSLTGNFVVNNNNTATLTLNITEDNFTENTEYLVIITAGGQTKTVTINDTSSNPFLNITTNTPISGFVYYPWTGGSLPTNYTDIMGSYLTNIGLANINITPRAHTSGFPGYPDQTENYTIEFFSKIILPENGNYQFRVNSDDGSRVFIANNIIVENDGVHAPRSITGNIINYTAGTYNFKAHYFQGPATMIAFVLEWKRPSSSVFEVIEPQYFTFGYDNVVLLPELPPAGPTAYTLSDTSKVYWGDIVNGTNGRTHNIQVPAGVLSPNSKTITVTLESGFDASDTFSSSFFRYDLLNPAKINWIHSDKSCAKTDWGTNTRVYKFSEPVTNPIISIYSLGATSKEMNLFTSSTINSVPTVWGILYSNSDSTYKICSTQGKYIKGKEGFGVLIFIGTYSEIHLISLTTEYYTNYCWGLAATTATQISNYAC